MKNLLTTLVLSFTFLFGNYLYACSSLSIQDLGGGNYEATYTESGEGQYFLVFAYTSCSGLTGRYFIEVSGGSQTFSFPALETKVWLLFMPTGGDHCFSDPVIIYPGCGPSCPTTTVMGSCGMSELTIDCNGNYTLDILTGTPMIIKLWEIGESTPEAVFCNAWNEGLPSCPTTYTGTVPSDTELYFDIQFLNGARCTLDVPIITGQLPVLDQRLANLTPSESLQEISIYPNPASSAMALDNTEGVDYQVEILSTTGSLIAQDKIAANSKKVINLDGLSEGFYLIRFINVDLGKSFVKKFTVVN